MKRFSLVCLLLAVAGNAAAQRYKVNINAETPEGAALQSIGQESDDAKKLALMEDFVGKYPKHDGAPWVYSQLQPAYVKASQWDKALDAGTKLLAVDPDDLETALANLKAAEAKKDLDLVTRWSAATSGVARKVVASPEPKEAEGVELWKKRVDYAKQVDIYTEYSIYAAGLQQTDPRKRLELFQELEKRNPQSQYVAMVQPQLFTLYQQIGDKGKALQIAEIMLAKDPTNEDMLLLAASHYYEGMKDKEKVHRYASKLVEILPAKPKPEGVADADWEKKKNLSVGLAHWMLGVMASNAQKWSEADKELRAALPLLKGNNDLTAETLFHLGLANYKIGDPAADKNRILEALRFNQECSVIPGRFQAQARKNVTAIRSQYHITGK